MINKSCKPRDFLQLGFLKQFGYLQEGVANSEALHTEEAVKNAIQNMQMYGGLHPSGEINEKTLEVEIVFHFFCSLNFFSCFPNPGVAIKMKI